MSAYEKLHLFSIEYSGHEWLVYYHAPYPDPASIPWPVARARTIEEAALLLKALSSDVEG